MILSNVNPIIPHFVIEEFIDNLNIKRSSAISSLKATITEEYSHVISERRQVYISPENVSKFSEILKVRCKDSVHFIFISTDTIRCFTCKQEGHIAKLCLNQNNLLLSHDLCVSNRIDQENFPKLSPINIVSEFNENKKVLKRITNLQSVNYLLKLTETKLILQWKLQ